MKSIGVLVSGRGSNLQALIDAQQAHALGGRIAVVVSNVAGAPALERARAAGIAAEVVEKGSRTREEHDREVMAVLRRHLVELVCLAGYMRLLSPEFVRAYPGRILNVHPSLLPAFPGRDAVRQAFEHGVKVTGATIHFVDERLDAGPILLQEAVPVKDDDDVDRLGTRVLTVEHALYARAVRLVLEGRCRVEGRRVRVVA